MYTDSELSLSAGELAAIETLSVLPSRLQVYLHKIEDPVETSALNSVLNYGEGVYQCGAYTFALNGATAKRIPTWSSNNDTTNPPDTISLPVTPSTSGYGSSGAYGIGSNASMYYESGILYYAACPNDSDLYLATSSNYGDSWSSSLIASASAGYTFGMVAIASSGRVYTVEKHDEKLSHHVVLYQNSGGWTRHHSDIWWILPLVKLLAATFEGRDTIVLQGETYGNFSAENKNLDATAEKFWEQTNGLMAFQVDYQKKKWGTHYQIMQIPSSKGDFWGCTANLLTWQGKIYVTMFYAVSTNDKAVYNQATYIYSTADGENWDMGKQLYSGTNEASVALGLTALTGGGILLIEQDSGRNFRAPINKEWGIDNQDLMTEVSSFVVSASFTRDTMQSCSISLKDTGLNPSLGYYLQYTIGLGTDAKFMASVYMTYGESDILIGIYDLSVDSRMGGGINPTLVYGLSGRDYLATITGQSATDFRMFKNELTRVAEYYETTDAKNFALMDGAIEWLPAKAGFKATLDSTYVAFFPWSTQLYAFQVDVQTIGAAASFGHVIFFGIDKDNFYYWNNGLIYLRWNGVASVVQAGPGTNGYSCTVKYGAIRNSFHDYNDPTSYYLLSAVTADQAVNHKYYLTDIPPIIGYAGFRGHTSAAGYCSMQHVTLKQPDFDVLTFERAIQWYFGLNALCNTIDLAIDQGFTTVQAVPRASRLQEYWTSAAVENSDPADYQSITLTLNASFPTTLHTISSGPSGAYSPFKARGLEFKISGDWSDVTRMEVTLEKQIDIMGVPNWVIVGTGTGVIFHITDDASIRVFFDRSIIPTDQIDYRVSLRIVGATSGTRDFQVYYCRIFYEISQTGDGVFISSDYSLELETPWDEGVLPQIPVVAISPTEWVNGYSYQESYQLLDTRGYEGATNFNDAIEPSTNNGIVLNHYTDAELPGTMVIDTPMVQSDEFRMRFVTERTQTSEEHNLIALTSRLAPFGTYRHDLVMGYKNMMFANAGSVVNQSMQTGTDTLTIDPGESGMQALKRFLDGRAVEIRSRHDCVMLYHIDSIGGAMNIWIDNITAISRSFNADEVVTHIRVYGAYVEAEYTDPTLSAEFKYKFTETNNPYLMNELECWTEAKRLIKEARRVAEQLSFSSHWYPHLEVNDIITILGAIGEYSGLWIIESIQMSWNGAVAYANYQLKRSYP